MNQDNKEFELSGTLGSLSDTALDNLDSAANTKVEENSAEKNITNQITNNEIETLDVPEQTNNFNQVVQPSTDTLDGNSENQEKSSEQDLSLESKLEPITTNFDIGDIGSVPPIDPTKKIKEKNSKKNKILFIIVIIIAIFAVGGLVFYYLRASKGSIKNAVETKNLTLELGEKISTNIEDYATFKSISSSNCVLNTKSVNNNKIGTYEYEITCGTASYKGEITLKDTKAPDVKTKTLVKKVNDELNPEDFIESCNEASKCLYSFENADEVKTYLSQAGNYDINIVTKDANENSTTTPAKLIVIEQDIKVYLNCELSDQTIENFDGVVSYIDKIGISPDSQYVGIYFKTREYMSTNEESYNKIKQNYNDNKVLDINNGVGIPKFDDANLTIIIEETLGGDAEFGTNYSSIKSYYETNNYRCNIMNVN